MIVLDTHALVWWVGGDARLSAPAREAIDGEHRDGGRMLVSVITAWELAMLSAKGRLTLSMSVDDWLADVRDIDAVDIVPLSISVAVQSTRLPGSFHADPADRMIVALAREYNAPVVTADGKMHRYAHVRCVW
jgi:PIN domain nuclease of toxin-antitoxin system